MVENLTYWWAKTTQDGQPGISVYEHMMNVGSVACCLAEASPEALERFCLHATEVGAFAALHDIGKITPGFQRKCKSWLTENNLETIDRNGCWDTGMEKNHGKVSHAMIQAFLVEMGLERKTAKYLSVVLGGHHGRLSPPNDRGYKPSKAIVESYSGIDWDAARKGNAQKIWDHFLESAVSFSVTDESPSLWWLAGLTSVADWIGSNEQFFSPERLGNTEDPIMLARQALDSIGYCPPLISSENLSFEDLFGFPPNDMQAKALAAVTGPGVYVIEAPMGMGKTEAALGVAYQLIANSKANGIYFALPTQATSNRIHLRMDKFLQRIVSEGPQSRLIHGNSWLMETDYSLSSVATEVMGKGIDDARTGRDWFASSKRALLAPFGVGTVDQALLGVVAAKHFFVRHFALAGKVVILDEVHSYDLYTGTLIDKLITTLEGLGCTVIILSATLTRKRLEKIVSLPEDTSGSVHLPYPLISGRKEGKIINSEEAIPPESRNVQVDFVSTDIATEEAILLAQKGGAVLWICNTVDSAQQQYRRFLDRASQEFPVGLLHSRFPFGRREELETEWMERFGKSSATRCGSILVSTQIVEQSVDLDADLLVTELAPTDMLLQRLGRLWRHERGLRPVDAPRICIIEEEKSREELSRMEPKEIVNTLGGKARVYAPFILLRSLEIWQQQAQVSLPGQIRELLESTYEDREEEPESWLALANEWLGTDSAKRMLAARNCNLWEVALEDEEGVQTRLNEMPTIAVVLCRKITDHEIVLIDGAVVCLTCDVCCFSNAQAIHKNQVKVPRYCFEHIEPCLAFSDIIKGEQCVGIVAEDGGVMIEGLQDGLQLFYSDEMGLVIEKSTAKEGV